MKNNAMVNTIFLAVGILCIAYYLLNGFVVRFGQSMLWVWLAAGICLIARFAVVRISALRGQPLPFPEWSIKTLRICAAAVFALFIGIEIMVVSGSFSKCPADVDYLIVLGAKTGSVSIHRRTDAAADYLALNPSTVCVVSGGKGPDEEMSEAEYMCGELRKRGISSERILIEDMSANTAENIRFSHVLADKPGASVAIVSNDYHLFRAKALARKEFGGSVYGIPAGSSAISYPHYAVREFFTIIVDTLRGNTRF